MLKRWSGFSFSFALIPKWKCESKSLSVVSNSLRPHGLYSPWNSPGQNTGVGSLSLLQGISPTQASNPGLMNYRRILYQLSHQGSLWFEGRVNMGSLAEVPKEELEELEVTIHKVLCGHETCFWTLRCSLSQRAPRTVWALGFESHTPFPTASS